MGVVARMALKAKTNSESYNRDDLTIHKRA